MRFWIAAAAVLLAAAPAGAEGRWSASLDPGVAVPAGRGLEGGGYELRNAPSFHLQANAGYEWMDQGYGVWLGLEGGYSPGHSFDGRIVSTDFDADGTRDSLAFTSDLSRTTYHLVPSVRARGAVEMGSDQVAVYFSVGAGWYHFSNGAGTGVLAGRATGGGDLTGRTFPIAASSNSYLGLAVGQGLGYDVTDVFEIGVDVRYHVVFKPNDPAQIVVPALRLGFHF